MTDVALARRRCFVLGIRFTSALRSIVEMRGSDGKMIVRRRTVLRLLLASPFSGRAVRGPSAGDGGGGGERGSGTLGRPATNVSSFRSTASMLGRPPRSNGTGGVAAWRDAARARNEKDWSRLGRPSDGVGDRARYMSTLGRPLLVGEWGCSTKTWPSMIGSGERALLLGATDAWRADWFHVPVDLTDGERTSSSFSAAWSSPRLDAAFQSCLSASSSRESLCADSSVAPLLDGSGGESTTGADAGGDGKSGCTGGDGESTAVAEDANGEVETELGMPVKAAVPNAGAERTISADGSGEPKGMFGDIAESGSGGGAACRFTRSTSG
jgi:hypothetical protein